MCSSDLRDSGWQVRPRPSSRIVRVESDSTVVPDVYVCISACVCGLGARARARVFVCKLMIQLHAHLYLWTIEALGQLPYPILDSEFLPFLKVIKSSLCVHNPRLLQYY